ncbi:MAG: RNase H-like domain-containing protein [Candidatus Thiodiazotropha endolucinida]|nr:DDE-type integrase/transposase/recombinase [Candidatus Thiodiazotropha taylori]MCW4261477.1 RNase H-like domain-containing protein [Candidatus Thiodiazotropha endolucinida]
MDKLHQPAEMDFSTSGNIAERWKMWKQTVQLYLDVAMADKSEKEQCKALLYIIGKDGREIYNTFVLQEAEQDKLAPLLTKFENYCIPKKNITMERHKFNTRTQGSTELIDQFVTDLKNIARECEFGDIKNDLIRDRIVCGTNSEKVKERLLREDKLTLEKAISICRADEESKRQIQKMNEDQENAVHYVKSKRKSKGAVGGARPKEFSDKKFQCGKCGIMHEKRKCPAYGKLCHKCQKPHHFAKLCKSKFKKNVHNLEENSSESDSENLYVGSINEKCQKKTEICDNEYFVTMDVNGVQVKFKIDTGSQCNIISDKVFKKVKAPHCILEKSTSRLTSYTGDRLKVLGKTTLNCMGHDLEFYVTDSRQTSLLGFKASQDLGLIKVVLAVNTNELDKLIREHPKAFSGLGCLEKPYKIMIDSTVTPVVNPPRKIPVALRKRVKKALRDMEKDGVIRAVDEPTDWVNSMVIVEKPNKKLRICLDPRNLNTAIKREHFQLPTIEEITSRMSGAKVFSKLDGKNSYWQLKLDCESQLLTTFNTPYGRYCYLRTPFGIKSAQEVYQKRISQLFEGLEGVETDIDDILIWGRSKEEHDQRLRLALKRCEDIGLTLNKDKCVIGVSSVTYIGHVLTQEGIKPDESKLKAISEMPAPTDKKGVMRLLGTVNYLAKFVPDMSQITEPIRMLLRQDVEFEWNSEQEVAFKKVKDILTSDPVLKYFDVSKPVTISCDASQSGLGAVLLQDNKPVAYASRSMTDAETRYAQIEKELLAVLFGMERFHQYTYGKEVSVECDHKPIESIVKKPLASSPPRLQRMLLRLQKYNYTVRYKPGSEMHVPDMLSRAYINETVDKELEEALRCHVHLVVSNLPYSDEKLKQIRNATKNDNTLSEVSKMIKEGWPDHRKNVPVKAREYWNHRQELSEYDGLILKGTQIVIPRELKREMLVILHESHFGIEKTCNLAKDIMFWVGMNAEIRDFISKCGICNEHRSSNQKEPMIPSTISELPWQVVGTDLFTWNGNNYVLVVDYMSRFFEVARLENMKSSTVINHMKSIFSRHGIPIEVRSDNGPCYASVEFQNFAKDWGFKHVTSSPYMSNSNGQAEIYVKIVKGILDKSKAENKDPYLSILNYRNTPIDNLGSPAQLLMNRRLRSKLPVTQKLLKPKIINQKTVHEKLTKKQEKQKYFYDKSSKNLSHLSPGDTIRVQNEKHWEPGIVVQNATTPRSYHVQTKRGQYRRNRKHLMKTNEKPINFDRDYDDDDQREENVDDSRQSDEPQGDTQGAKPYVTRSGRVVRIPTRFKDYVT